MVTHQARTAQPVSSQPVSTEGWEGARPSDGPKSAHSVSLASAQSRTFAMQSVKPHIHIKYTYVLVSLITPTLVLSGGLKDTPHEADES